MPKVRAARHTPHPLVQALLQHLPEGQGLQRRTFVLASSAAAAGALRDAVARERPALLGVRFLTPPAFAHELLWLLGAPARAGQLLPLAERALLRRVLRGARSEVAAYALRHRASTSALLATCREWSRAGAPQPGGELSPWGRETLAVAQAFVAALEQHELPGRTQNVARARRLLAAGTRLRCAVLVAVVGHDDAGDVAALLDDLARTGQATVVRVPAAACAPCATSRSAHPNLDAELRAAAHRCALAFAGGAALRDLVVAAPRLGPYVPLLAAAFAAEGIPLRAHAETPLSHEPRGALALHAVRLLFDGAPPRAYLALAGSALARAPLAPAEQQALERQARRLGLGGVEALPARVADALEHEAPAAAATVRRLARSARAAAELRRTDERARALAELLHEELAPPPPGGRDADAAAFLADAMGELAYADDDEFLLDALDLLTGRGLPVGARDGTAVHVVEYADALAFPACHLALLGAADGQLPQAAALPTFFSENDRQALGLAPRAAARAREAQALRGLAQLPTAALHVSRPLNDGQGRPLGPSPLLASVLGATLAGCTEQVEHAHPQPRAAARVASGLAPLDLAVVHAALARSSAAAASKLLGARGSQAIQRVQRLERFAGDLACDGDVGALARAGQGTLSVSDLELLARCAHQFLFRKELKLVPLPPEPDALALAPGAVGSAVHELLSQLHERLVAAAAPGAADVDASALAAELAPRLDALLRQTSPLPHTLPALHRILVRQWSRAVATSFADDAQDLRAHGTTPLCQERQLEGSLPLGDGRALAVRGRADRIDRLADGTLRVIDYKTGAQPASVLAPTDILKGRKLQMPAYAAMAQQTLQAEARELGVRAVRPGDRSAELWQRWRHAADFRDGKFAAGLRETLRVLADLRACGAFVPSLDADKVCRFCEFRAACRRLHPPSRERLWNSDRPEVQRYLALRRKSYFAPELRALDAS